MALNKSKVHGVLSPDVKEALQQAVVRFTSQVKVAQELGVSSAVVSTLLKDKYTGDVAAMEERIRGKFLGATVLCPVQGTLSKASCLDNQALPMAFTNPIRAALGRACKKCHHRKELA